MHVSLDNPRAVTHAGPSVHRVCPAAFMKAIMSSSIDRERGKGLETEIEAEYIVGDMSFDVHLRILNYRKYLISL